MALKIFLLALCLTVSLAFPDRQQQQQAPRYPPPPQPQPQQSQYAQPAPAPKPLHIPERNCSVEFEKAESEICVPELVTTCEPEEVVLMAPVEQEKCIEVVRTNCHANVEEAEVEVCVYQYEKKDKQVPAKVVDVKYTKRCDTNYISVCKPKKSYGYQKEEECKEVPQETCYNRPQTESEETEVTVTIPVPVKKCKKQRVQIPNIECEEEREERCFNLVALEETTQSIEKCITEPGEPRCEPVNLQLPAQTCVEELKEYERNSYN